MENTKFKKGNSYLLLDYYGNKFIGNYIGKQDGFGCVVCDKGCKCDTFNVFYDKDINGYETWGFGKEHLPRVLKDYGKVILNDNQKNY